MPSSPNTLNRRAVMKLAGKGALGGLAMAALPGPVTAALAASQRLEIAGNALLAGGKPIRLLGVAVGDPLFVRAKRSIDDFRVIANDWRANVVRISLHPSQWRNDREASLIGLTRDITAARANGLWVILDWHAIGAPDGWYDKPGEDWGLPEDVYKSSTATALEFWTEMAKIFGADPGVVFELWNEPTVDPRVDESTGNFWAQLKPAWLKMIAAIRKHSEVIVLASGARFAHDLQQVKSNLIDDPRTAYAWHCYPNEDKGKAGRWHSSLDGLPKIKPVFVTEWGFCNSCGADLEATAASFGQVFMDSVLEPYRLHSTAWCYSPGASPQMLEQDDRPTEFGAFVKHQIATAARP